MKQNDEKAFYHINSAGENVVFRDEMDFIQFMNDIALAGFGTLSEILAFIIMSTHFHLCVITEHVDELVRILKQSYTRYFQHRYGIVGKVMDIEVWKKEDVQQQINALNYVLKNSVHHEVCYSPFQYPYSSIGCYFKKQLSRSERYYKEFSKGFFTHPSDLKGREKRAILRYYKLPDKYLIQDKRLIVPESYVNTRIVEGFYRNSYKSFLVEMNKNTVENDMGNDSSKRYVTTESLLISEKRISDMEVCKIIDEYVKCSQKRSFKALSPNESIQLSQYLQKLGANRPQIQRCLWQ